MTVEHGLVINSVKLLQRLKNGHIQYKRYFKGCLHPLYVWKHLAMRNLYIYEEYQVGDVNSQDEEFLFWLTTYFMPIRKMGSAG